MQNYTLESNYRNVVEPYFNPNKTRLLALQVQINWDLKHILA